MLCAMYVGRLLYRILHDILLWRSDQAECSIPRDLYPCEGMQQQEEEEVMNFLSRGTDQSRDQRGLREEDQRKLVESCSAVCVMLTAKCRPRSLGITSSRSGAGAERGAEQERRV